MIDRQRKALIEPLRAASRLLVRELGFMGGTLAGTRHPPSAVHALIEIGRAGRLAARDLCGLLNLDKSSVSRMLRKLIEAGEIDAWPDGQDARSKYLTLTAKGRGSLKMIDNLACRQVDAALALLPAETRRQTVDGLAAYAQALKSCRTGQAAPEAPPTRIEAGYRHGVAGRAAFLHASYYGRHWGFGALFESKVAAGMADFILRLDRPCNGLWTALDGDVILGMIAIDGEDLGDDTAHLRWFILDETLRGQGLGSQLLAEAVAFCDRRRFARIRLWTFKGLEAARRLYEKAGFVLEKEYSGNQWGKDVTEQIFVRTCRQAS
jgi:DNA-binding MarR family transcriptional regulator/RimJ/RimL family protein N-acetyltransferase